MTMIRAQWVEYQIEVLTKSDTEYGRLGTLPISSDGQLSSTSLEMDFYRLLSITILRARLA
jgi:hypothetical protein